MNAVTFDHDAAALGEVASPLDEGRARMAKRTKLFALLGGALLAVGGGYWLLADNDHVSTDNAYVNAEAAQVTPQVAGPVAQVFAHNTQAVKKGDLLMRIDPTDARLALARAEADWERVRRQYGQLVATGGALDAQAQAGGAEVARARAQLGIASSAFEKARLDLSRRSSLVDSGAVSSEELTAARNALAAAHGNVGQAQAGYEQAIAARNAALGNRAANAALVSGSTVDTHPDVIAAKARLDAARVDLARTEIRAPIAGIVTNNAVQVGQRAAPGSPVMTIVPIASAYVDANFKEGQLKRVRPGQPVELVSDLYGSKVIYHGRVVGFSGGTGSAFSLIPAQNATGNWIKVVQRLPVRVTLDPRELAANPLRVGLSMEATIDVSGKN